MAKSAAPPDERRDHAQLRRLTPEQWRTLFRWLDEREETGLYASSGSGNGRAASDHPVGGPAQSELSRNEILRALIHVDRETRAASFLHRPLVQPGLLSSRIAAWRRSN